MAPASIARRSLWVAISTLASLGVTLDSAIASRQAEALRGLSQMPVRVMKRCRLGSREDQLQTAVMQYLN
ncbi:MAG: hypothetical protein SNJ81_15305 [Cyanobacteriota bacterium]